MKLIENLKFGDELELIPFESQAKLYAKYYGSVQAGFPSPAEDFGVKKLSLDERYVSNPDNTFFVRSKGNSMFPTIQSGDLLIVKSNIPLSDNKIPIVSVNNTEYSVKRYNAKLKSLIPDNPRYESIQINENDVVVCLGIVVNLIRDL